MIKYKFIITVIIFIITISNLNAQEYITQCPLGQFTTGYYSPNNVTGGMWKPHRTDANNAPVFATLRVLLVFVQFVDDSVETSYWPIGDTPIYKNDLLALVKDTIGNYWDRYSDNTETLSDWYQEVSKGQMHVTGEAYSIILDSNALYYKNVGLRVMNQEIINKLTAAGVDWQQYDKWTGSNGNFYYTPDDYIDMIIKVHRTKKIDGLFFENAPGVACLGPNPWSGIDIHVGNEKKIYDGFSSLGSGVTIVGTAEGPLDKARVFNIAKHEYGHYLFGAGHTGSGVGIMGGGEIYLGLWESMKLGYLDKTIVNFNTVSYQIGDVTSHSSDGEILQVPVNGNSEYFLISNRRKVSLYDRTMLGDTTKGIWERILSDNAYGKGIYIYHHNHDFEYQSANDMECADGLWNWSYMGQTTPDWSNDQFIDVYIRSSASNIPPNDDGYLSYDNKDGRTCGHYSGSYAVNDVWFGIGKRHISLNGESIDRIYTTDENYWTSREWKGDRYDAWNIGYNEIFSPYSSPNTFSWSNDTTGIFIYYDTLDGNTANIKIYRATEFGGETDLADILQYTPPSRPMGLIISISECDNDRLYPVLTWNHNMEPDMIQNEKEEKRYKIFRAYNQYGTVPQDYLEIADLLINKDEQPVYKDTNVWNPCWDGNYLQNSIRYKIIAIDNTNWASVFSDFVSFSSEDLERGNSKGSLTNNDNTIKNYSLSQNYPNPFNPSTKINFSLPKQGFVTLKIYDILGREIKTLVNEIKQAGNYTVDFNASEFSSGVYFYRLESGTFSQIKRMLMIK